MKVPNPIPFFLGSGFDDGGVAGFGSGAGAGAGLAWSLGGRFESHHRYP